jgi:hypothetical protein
MLARISIKGFKKARCLDEASSLRYKALPTPKGTHINKAPAVTHKDPKIKGKIPKSGGSKVGYQYFPKRNLNTLTSLKIGKPSLKRTMVIPIKKTKEAKARILNIQR